MQVRSGICLTIIIMLLSACGRPETIVISSSTQPPATPQTIGDNIAQLLQNSPVPGTSVELDTYVWRGWSGGEGPSLTDHDAQGCPTLNTATTLLTDQPTPWMLPILHLRFSNFSPDYPPDSAPWLVISGNDSIPYHARLRGHLGDPSVAKCSFAKHIFTVERVVTTYEQNPSDLGDMKVPDTYPNWARYHDATLGYSFLYPSDWRVETSQRSDLVAELAVGNPKKPDYPILIRIHNGETYYDQYDTAHTPALLKFQGGVFSQDTVPIDGTVTHQHLAGYYIRYDPPDRHTQQTGVLFNAGGHSYELLVRYPIGLDALRDLTITYTFLVLSFQFDIPPGPTPTPPIKQSLGEGPFLSKEQVLSLVRKQYGAETILLDSQLVSEAEARRRPSNCQSFEGHPDGVWLFKVHGIADDKPSTIQLYIDAVTGTEVCSEVAPDLDAPTALPKTANPTPIPGTTPTPFSESSTSTPAASPYPAPQPNTP